MGKLVFLDPTIIKLSKVQLYLNNNQLELTYFLSKDCMKIYYVLQICVEHLWNLGWWLWEHQLWSFNHGDTIQSIFFYKKHFICTYKDVESKEKNNFFWELNTIQIFKKPYLFNIFIHWQKSHWYCRSGLKTS